MRQATDATISSANKALTIAPCLRDGRDTMGRSFGYRGRGCPPVVWRDYMHALASIATQNDGRSARRRPARDRMVNA